MQWPTPNMNSAKAHNSRPSALPQSCQLSRDKSSQGRSWQHPKKRAAMIGPRRMAYLLLPLVEVSILHKRLANPSVFLLALSALQWRGIYHSLLAAGSKRSDDSMHQRKGSSGHSWLTGCSLAIFTAASFLWVPSPWWFGNALVFTIQNI